MSIEKAMGLGELLAGARVLVPGWGLRHRLLGELASVGDVFRVLPVSRNHDRDEVLRDVAHLVTTHLLEGGQVRKARAAAETALTAAPDETIIRSPNSG